NLWVETIRAGDSVVLRIRDDGRGFAGATAVAAAGLGMLSMRERCNILGATLRIDSGVWGTRVDVRIPPQQDSAGDAIAAQPDPAMKRA
ncbi:MAG TPA: hypothetical protein VEQ17_05090, partial [Steroidobacteraceae bacterium]|nr:hypothetical protein [Steroidobacteraceae bacterium]